jgi:flagellar basal body rod protein FlgG
VAADMVELYGISRAGMKLSNDYLNIVSFNIANVNTDGFKALSPIESSGYGHDIPVVNGHASVVDNAYFFSVNAQSLGSFLPTSSSYALSNPEAYFVVSDGNNKWMTRQGDFQIDSQGNITVGGLYVLNGSGNLATSSDVESKNIMFVQANTEQYDRDSHGFIYKGTEQQINADQAGFTEGYLESSNVDLSSEMVKLISAQRAYQFSSKAFHNADDLIETTLNLKGA